MKKLITTLSVLTLATSGALNSVLLPTLEKVNSLNVIQNNIQQDTIYIDKDGKKVISSETDLSNINTTKITQIGFYENKEGQIQAIKMPKSIKEVPTILPPEITCLTDMFKQASAFNQDISNWDVSNIVNMKSMFAGAKSFNNNISNWNTKNVMNMEGMFYKASAFNQDISKWKTSNVKNMWGMFWEATSFNQDLSDWDVSNVRDMSGMFFGAISFNKSIGQEMGNV